MQATHTDVPETAAYVRGSTRSFYRVSPMPAGGGCYVELATSTDPKGIPSQILQLFKAKTAQYFCSVRDHLQKAQ